MSENQRKSRREDEQQGLGCAIPAELYRRMKRHLLDKELDGERETQGEYIARLIEEDLGPR